MAKSFLFLPSLLLLPLLMSFNLGATLVVSNYENTWCVAKTSSSDTELLSNIAFACNNVDCSPIQEGGPCFYPNTLLNHASVVMNIYYQKFGKQAHNCNFQKSGLIVVIDPSYGGCKYMFESGCGKCSP